MRLSAVELVEFRGITATVELGGMPSIITGANNSGKSAVLDAIRLATLNYVESRSSIYVSESDFSHDSSGARTSSVLHISLLYTELTFEEAGRMVTCLSPRRGARTATVTLSAEIDSRNRVRVKWTGGDNANSDIESFSKSAVRHIYLPALRDAVRDLRPGPTNRLRNLVAAFNNPDGEDADELEAILKDANSRLRQVGSVNSAAHAMAAQLSAMTGDSVYRHNADLKFSDPTYSRILTTLHTALGAEKPLDINESGMGYTNLLYMAVLLAVLERAPDDPLYLLLVEEPEAHLHPQLQTLLTNYLNEFSSDRVQVIVTTHSPQLTSGAELSNISIMARDELNRRKSRPLHKIDLDAVQQGYLRRFFDATKSTMLFANGVILVEGIAEQLVIPELSRIMGIGLDRHGVSIVNIGGVGFTHFLPLFGEHGMPTRCSVITDGDPVEVQGSDGESEFIESNRATLLRERATQNINVKVATTTFEWDLAYANFKDGRDTLLRALSHVKPRKAERLRQKQFFDARIWANEFYAEVEAHKGAYAMFLAEEISKSTSTFVVPSYLQEAIRWTCPAHAQQEEAQAVESPDNAVPKVFQVEDGSN